MSNLRETKREISALKRALGVEDVEANNMTQPMKSSRPPTLAPPESKPTKAGYAKKSYRTTPDKQLYEATGGSGQISVRASVEPLVAGIDVADPAGSSERKRLGQVWNMFTTTGQAEKEAVKLRAQGLTVNVVTVRPYAGQPGDNQEGDSE